MARKISPAPKGTPLKIHFRNGFVGDKKGLPARLVAHFNKKAVRFSPPKTFSLIKKRPSPMAEWTLFS
jgi:hypothetical protein